MLSPMIVFLALALFSGGLQAESGASSQIPPDNSLESGAYIAEGLPPYDRVWAGEDYAEAAAALKKIAEAKLTHLPRVNSPRSGAVFARMVSPDNLALATPPSLDQEQHLLSLAALLQGAADVYGVYFTASQTGVVFDSELVDLGRYLLEGVSVIVPIVEEIMAATPPGDPSREALLESREKMRQGFAATLRGALTTLTETSSYRTAELVRLSVTLESTLPTIYSFLPADVQRELPDRLSSMVAAESDPALKASLARLLDSVGKSLPKAPLASGPEMGS